MTKVIDSFRGEYLFLSNFFACDIDVRFVWAPRVLFKMPTVEHAFQAMKTIHSGLDDSDKMLWLLSLINGEDPARAKVLGRNLEINVVQWNRQSEFYMGRILQQKFLQHPDLAQRLIATEDATLIEGNTWGDKLWGQVNGEGENKLGNLLMQIRAQLVDSPPQGVVD